MEEFYNVEDAAKKLKTSSRQIVTYIKLGQLKAFPKIGKQYIMHTELVKFIQSGKTEK